jgi:hypothetical protein
MSGTTIPASAIVSVIPSVLSAGGSGLVMNGLMLDGSTRTPVGQVLTFPSAAAVAAYYGATSAAAAWATVYFNGFTTATQLPGSLLIAQYPATAVGAYLRGGNVSTLTLAALQALTGTLILTINGTTATSSAINLTSATSFSSAAALIQAAFTSPGFAVSFDSTSGGFVFTNTLTGATSTISYATGTLSSGLLLTAVTGSVTSQGAAAAVPGTFMNGIVAVTQNWVTFGTNFNPDSTGNANKLLFSQWASNQNNRYAYVCWDTDITPTQSNAAMTSLGYLIKAQSLSGTILIYDPTNEGLVPFAMGWGACLDFEEENGAATLAFKQQAGLSATVTGQTAAANLLANGYNFYGAYGTANQSFIWFQNGQLSGAYGWADSFLYQVWLSNAFQLALMELLASVNSIPYNAAGYAMIEGTLYSGGGTNSSQLAGADSDPVGPIAQAVNFGVIDSGTSLSSTQIQAVNNAAGKNIATTLMNRGWYLQVLDPGAQARAARTTPACTFWYCSGGSVQQISIASIELQ